MVLWPEHIRAAAGESVETIRHWTKAGLLEVAERCAEIRRLQGERLTLKEIGGRVL
jgi:DNA-binding transcriptional MerR regulator